MLAPLAIVLARTAVLQAVESQLDEHGEKHNAYNRFEQLVHFLTVYGPEGDIQCHQ